MVVTELSSAHTGQQWHYKEPTSQYIKVHIPTGDMITVDCVPDDMSTLAMEIRMDSGLVGTHMYHLKVYKDTVVGKDLVQWLVAQKSMSKNKLLYLYSSVM